MKNFLIVLCFISCEAGATNYYLSNSGNDNNSGNTPSTAWQTLNKLNTVTFAAGDTIFLSAGDLFRGMVNLHQGGNGSADVVFTSYGNGQKPVISGAEQINAWLATGSGYTANFNQPARNFFVNDQEMTIARYPNEHNYLWLDSATQTDIFDAQLNVPQITSWPGTRVCIHTSQWAWEKSPVTNYTPGQLTFAPTQLIAMPGYGYFLYNNPALLDTALEYFNDTIGHTIYYLPPAGQDPNLQDCEASVLPAGIRIFPNVSNVHIYNIAFDKQLAGGIVMSDSTINRIRIDHCSFFRQYSFGVGVKGKRHVISDCLFRFIDGHGIDISSGGNSEIHHNIFRGIGQYRNSGIGGQTNGSAIAVNFTDSCYIHHNNIDSTGYCGISADGGFHLIERNMVNNAMMLNNDGAPYKTFGDFSHDIIFRNNIAIGSNGNTEGTANGNFKTPAFYCDFSSHNILIENNTVYNHDPKGIFLNSGSHDITVRGNVIYGTDYGIDFNGGQQNGAAPIFGHSATHNVCFALRPQAVCMRQVDYSLAWNFGAVDSNYYWQPYDSTHTALRYYNGPQPYFFSLSAWQDTTGKDSHTKKNFDSWTLPVNNSQLFVNATDTVSTIQLGALQFLDLDSNPVCVSIQLQPFSSVVLINTAINCNTGIPEPDMQAKLKSYPNPFSDELIIQTPSFNKYDQAEVYDVYGRRIFAKQFTSVEMSINTTTWSNGIYFVRLGNAVVKVVK